MEGVPHICSMIFRNKSNTSKKRIPWEALRSEAQLNAVLERSKNQPVLIFKHSTRCSISSTALARMEREWNPEGSSFLPYYLDLLAHRGLSNQVAEILRVRHESPQAILIKKGKVVHHTSHMSISIKQIQEVAGHG